MTTYEVVHRTEYRYESDVSSSYGLAYLIPRSGQGQICRSSMVDISPGAGEHRSHTDIFGNQVLYFSVHAPHRTLVVTAASVVDVDVPPGALPMVGSLSWELAREQLRQSTDPDEIENRQFLSASPMVELSDRVAEFARQSFAPGRPIVEVLADLTSRIHDQFTYKPGATTIGISLDALFDVGKGVCQDFAHLAVGCLRTMGIAARYVSGYLETDPPPGRPRLVGADVSHAWASAFVPGVGWVDIDPTNDCFVSGRYVTTAWGRDYADVPPLKGVIFTESPGSELSVSVDVRSVNPG
ncbi:MAG: transglutaminase N-terminal domain-containing protein [Acidimicrobiia bacterium]